MLSALDDMLWHQLPTTFDHVGTSDPRFYDRHWFAMYDPAGDRAIQFTLAAYSNMDVMDGAIAVVTGGRQHNLRVSRTLRPRFETACGPLSVEVVEPMRRLSLAVADGGHGVSGAIEWTGIVPPEEEVPHFHRRDGRIVEDYVRFNQIGRAEGALKLGEETIDLANWWACRDHSWGVRPDVGAIAEPRKATRDEDRRRDFAFCFLFFSTETLSGHAQTRADDHAGDYATASVVGRASGEPIDANDFEVRASLIPGTRLFDRVDFEFPRANGGPLRVSARRIANAIVMPGLGYSGGWSDRKGLGVWRGADCQEGEDWDVSDPEIVKRAGGKAWRPLHRIYPVAVTASDGSSGTGSLTWLLIGDVPRLTGSEN